MNKDDNNLKPLSKDKLNTRQYFPLDFPVAKEGLKGSLQPSSKNAARIKLDTKKYLPLDFKINPENLQGEEIEEDSKSQSEIVRNRYIPILERKMDRLMKYETEIIYENEKIDPQRFLIMCLCKYGLLEEENAEKIIIDYLKNKYPDETRLKTKTTLLAGEIWEWLIAQDAFVVYNSVEEFLYETTIQEAQNLWKSIQAMLLEMRKILAKLEEKKDDKEISKTMKDTQEFLIYQVNIYEFLKKNLENVGLMDHDYTLIYEVFDLFSEPDSHKSQEIRPDINYELMDVICKNLIRKREGILQNLNYIKQLQAGEEENSSSSTTKNSKLTKFFK